jgi:NAD(P)-dependent dehydrogenase (short-subunit alcohol dehydrogenase family)
LLMKGKTVVITGGTSGIGEVAAEALAQMGARIILVARNKSRADVTLSRLGRSGPGERAFSVSSWWPSALVRLPCRPTGSIHRG